MPNAPNVEGLPLWLQIGVTLLFGIVTLLVGWRGYFPREKPLTRSPETQNLFDMVHAERLSEAMRTMALELLNLARTLSENTHHLRESNEITQEACQRMRELRERIDRRGL